MRPFAAVTAHHRQLIATAALFAAAAAMTTLPAAADNASPPNAAAANPDAPSPVYNLTNAQFDHILGQFKGILAQNKFDGIAVAENHCYPQMPQFFAAPKTVALLNTFKFSGVMAEIPDNFQDFLIKLHQIV